MANQFDVFKQKNKKEILESINRYANPKLDINDLVFNERFNHMYVYKNACNLIELKIHKPLYTYLKTHIYEVFEEETIGCGYEASFTRNERLGLYPFLTVEDYMYKKFLGHFKHNGDTSISYIVKAPKKWYKIYLESEKWIKKRNTALKLSNYECSRCKSKKNLEVHHLNYKNIGEESQNDLFVCCRSCHKYFHKK